MAGRTTHQPPVAAVAATALPEPLSKITGTICGSVADILLPDEKTVFQARVNNVLGAEVDGESPNACIRLDFGSVVTVHRIRARGRHVEQACGHSCTGEACGTGGSLWTFMSVDGVEFKVLTRVTLTPTLSWADRAVARPELRYLLVCRGPGGNARDGLEMDYVDVCIQDPAS